MSKKLLETAKEKLSNQLLTEFEDFYAFLKAEDMTFSQGYKCYKFKYDGADVGKIKVDDNIVRCNVSLELRSNGLKYIENQPEELVDIYMKSLDNKCTNCRDGRTGCSKQLGMTVKLADNIHKNICVQGFGDFLQFSFESIEGSMRTMMRTTPKIAPAIDNDSPVSIGTVKGLILIKKAYIMGNWDRP